jgi:hypothetical protein
MFRKRTSCLLVIGALLLVLTGSAIQSEAGVSVGINLPVVNFAAPPDLAVIPGTYVYMVPDIAVDVLFYQGYWWRPYEGHWYRSKNYKGPWGYIEPGKIPGGLRALPQDYRHCISPGYERLHYGDVQKNWKTWETEKHWDRQGAQGHGGQGQVKHEEQGEHDRGGHGEGREEEKGRY